MPISNKLILTSLVACLMAFGTLGASVQINAGQSDFTIFYNPAGADFNGEGTNEAKWHFVARAKGDTVGTFNGDPMTETGGNFTWNGQGGSSADYAYNNLNIAVTSPITYTRHGKNYFITPASGTSYSLAQNPNDPDIGIRTRLNDAGAVGFESVQFTLDTSASTFNGVSLDASGVDVLIFRDATLNAVTLVDTFDEVFTWENPLSNHIHYNWGFSDVGEYSLTFNVQGLDSESDPIGIAGSGTIDFSVVPEPSVYALAFGLAVFGFVFVRRRLRS